MYPASITDKHEAPQALIWACHKQPAASAMQCFTNGRRKHILIQPDLFYFIYLYRTYMFYSFLADPIDLCVNGSINMCCKWAKNNWPYSHDFAVLIWNIVSFCRLFFDLIKRSSHDFIFFFPFMENNHRDLVILFAWSRLMTCSKKQISGWSACLSLVTHSLHK